jgi:hypothetical protein
MKDKKEEVENNNSEKMEIEEEKNKDEQIKVRKDESQNNNKENKNEKMEDRKDKNENNENKENKKTYIGRKRGRYSNKDKLDEKNHDHKVHSGNEKGNMEKKILIAFIRSLHQFVNSYTKFKFFIPTITKDITCPLYSKIQFFHITLKDLFNEHTFPKNLKGLGNLKNMNEEEKIEWKKAKVKEHNKPIMEIMDDEENMRKKKENETKMPITALMELTIIDFLRIFLDYGYDGNDCKTIVINETKYGFESIDLSDFETYIRMRSRFNSEEKTPEEYRLGLKKTIGGV